METGTIFQVKRKWFGVTIGEYIGKFDTTTLVKISSWEHFVFEFIPIVRFKFEMSSFFNDLDILLAKKRLQFTFTKKINDLSIEQINQINIILKEPH